MTTAELLKSLRSLLAYHQGIGIDRYRDRGGIRRGVDLLSEVAREGRRNGPEPSLEPAGTTGVAAAEKKPATPEIIAELHDEIARCTSCALHETRRIDTAGTGGCKPLLLVVGDWLEVPGGVEPHDSEMFGAEQDEMLARMIAAIRLEPQQVYCTNVIKCSVPSTVVPTAAQIDVCSGYLVRQIQILSPRVICTMGNNATRALLAVNRSLFKLRGRFHRFESGSGQKIPLMPTFHPSFLLENPEMKQATWQDLQAIQKMLRNPGGAGGFSAGQ